MRPLRTTDMRRACWGIAGVNVVIALGFLVSAIIPSNANDIDDLLAAGSGPLGGNPSGTLEGDLNETTTATAIAFQAWDRPLRNPLYDPAPVSPPPPPPLRFELLGTLVQGEQRSALIQTSQGQKLIRVGEIQDDARIIRIEPDQVTIEYHGQEQVLTPTP